MTLELLKIVIGVPVAMFIPGYLLVESFFREFSFLERIAFSITFSVMINTVISIFLGYNKEWASVTGGLTFTNIALAELFVIGALFIVYVGRKKYRKRVKKTKVYVKHDEAYQFF